MAKQKNFALKGKITPDGKGVIFDHAEVLAPSFLSMALEPVDIQLTLGKVKRSVQQNRYLWGVVYVVIRQELRNKYGEDFTPEEIHAHNLQKIQGVAIKQKEINGINVLVIEDKKSSDMTTEEFTEMIEKLRDWYAVNKEIFIPDMQGDATINDYV